MLKNFQPFIHVIESAAVPVFAFGPYGQWEACQNKAKRELKNNIPGKREHPSEKKYRAASDRRPSADEYYKGAFSREDDGSQEPITLHMSKLAEAWPDI